MTEIPNHDLKAEQSNFSPIFVVGCSRSGTTLVRQLLNAHSQIAIAPETWFVKRIWYQFKDVEESSRATLIDYVLNLDVFRDMNLDTIEYRKRAMHKENFVARDAFKLMLEMYGELHEATELGEKTPNHLMHMDELQSLFPDSRFVYIVRDPRAVVASRNKVPWSGGSNYHNAQVWRTYYQSGENLTPHVDNIFQLHYEQLVSSPMDILKELMVFLNLEYEESMLSFHHTSKDLVNVNREPWKAGITRPLSIDSITKWRKVLSKRAVYVIESTTYQGMKALGYERDYPDLSLLPGRILVFVFNVARKIKSFFSPIYRRLFPLPER